MAKSDNLIKLCEIKKIADGGVYADLSTRYNIPTDEVGGFFVVIKARETSELSDIVFKTNMPSMMIQSRGGLEIHDIIGIYTDVNQAMKVGKEELTKVKK
jgi:aminopeptidase-like protein